MDKDTESRIKKIKMVKELKTRKQQIDDELNRIKQLLLNDDNIDEISLIIQLKLYKDRKARFIWSGDQPSSDLTFMDEVKRNRNM
jgi:hypothetical protein